MIVHLGMTGKFFTIDRKMIKRKTSFYYNLNDEKDQKYNRLIFIFKNNSKLIYNDVRKFGFIKIDNIKKIEENFHLRLIGPNHLKVNSTLIILKNLLKKGNFQLRIY